MRNFLQTWRLKLALGWPRLTRLERLTAYFAAIALLLFVVAKIAALFGGDAGLDGWFQFIAIVTGVLGLLVAARYIRRVLMWRLRNRLIVTYVFIGVIPVVLLVLIGALSSYLFGWQFATYIATSDIQTEVSTLQALNQRAAVQMSQRIAQGASLTPELLAGNRTATPDGRMPEMTAWYGGKSVALTGEEPALPPPPDKKLAGGLVLDEHQVFFRVANSEPVGSGKLTVISSVPLDTQSLDRIGAGLGEISFTLFTPDDKKQSSGEQPTGLRITRQQPQESKLTVGKETLDMKTPNRNHTLRAGKLPPPQNALDRVVTGGTILPVLDWHTGGKHNALLGVLTRPSLLYDRLFVTVGGDLLWRDRVVCPIHRPAFDSNHDAVDRRALYGHRARQPRRPVASH
jgi:sigma-B regulation protein RsbU (phosphoserine phosphatase)